MNHLSVLMLSVLAFACLALAVERQQEDLFGRVLACVVTQRLRGAGWLLLVVSLVAALSQPLWAVGLVAWFGGLSAGAGVVFLALVVAARVRQARVSDKAEGRGGNRGSARG